MSDKVTISPPRSAHMPTAPEYSMSSSPVLCEIRSDGIAVVTLNRPNQRNCFNPEVIVRLAALWKEINANDAVRVVIITGSGDKAFCAGADLKRRA